MTGFMVRLLSQRFVSVALYGTPCRFERSGRRTHRLSFFALIAARRVALVAVSTGQYLGVELFSGDLAGGSFATAVSHTAVFRFWNLAMNQISSLVLMTSLVLSCSASVQAAEPNAGADSRAEGILFSESFEDADLARRGWYDGTSFPNRRRCGGGKGCIEYEWTDSQSGVKGSSPVRRLFEPTDEVSIRFYLKLSKGWGWSGQNFHPHLTHFLTTENSKWHGPAASHLTLYIEPVGGKLRLAAQDIQNKDMPHGLTQGPLRGGYNGKFYDSQEVLFKDDQWHCVEAYFKLNTLDLENDRPNQDGIVRGWFDGKAGCRAHRRGAAIHRFSQHEVQPVPDGSLLRAWTAAARPEVVDRRIGGGH
jgi:hypothetical protein